MIGEGIFEDSELGRRFWENCDCQFRIGTFGSVFCFLEDFYLLLFFRILLIVLLVGISMAFFYRRLGNLVLADYKGFCSDTVRIQIFGVVWRFVFFSLYFQIMGIFENFRKLGTGEMFQLSFYLILRGGITFFIFREGIEGFKVEFLVLGLSGDQNFFSFDFIVYSFFLGCFQESRQGLVWSLVNRMQFEGCLYGFVFFEFLIK